jgi:hypothetical protein
VIKKYYQFIIEGFNTYPFSKIRQFLKRKGLKEGIDFYQQDEGFFYLGIKPNHIGKYNEILTGIENVYGWYLAEIMYDTYDIVNRKDSNFKIPNCDLDLKEYINSNDIDDEDDEIYTLMFESKTGTIVDYDKLPDILYHVSDTKYLDKILKVGLVPKSKSKKAYHPDRIYLATDKKECTWLYNDPDFDVKKPVLFKIDRNKLEEKGIYLYKDPYLPSGVFAIKNIPKDCLISYNIANI